ncbi:DUF4434 domain-containing protein [Clostridium sp. JN-1]|uniref:DUF4434 domain-containing protein n=1 Tax=Clostridium sp. JN-1 TaxID=2483110 RepID=UPI000F0BC553|nr:DUF4434 domain-containing protein [Clostridium sp. JN-1]
MKLKKNISKICVCVFIIFIFVFIYFNSPLKKSTKPPRADGTFIQVDLAQNWNDEKWKKELTYLKEANMHYIVLSGVSITKDNITQTAYKSSIPGFQKIYGNYDPVDLCLKNAEDLNMKVFIDTNFNSDWWNKSGDDANWLNEQVVKMNSAADELYSKYHSKYPNSFYGWYFPYEVDNAKFSTQSQFLVLSNAVNNHLKHLVSKNERLPFLMSPFMNSFCSSANEYAENWKVFFKNTQLKPGDIFCPQDSIGSGKLKIDEVNEWFTALKKAVNSKSGLLLWANAETFDYRDSSSSTLDRFTKQLKLESPCVDNIICFSYSHYYSPNNIDDGFHKAYIKYLKKGTLSNVKINEPKDIYVSSISNNQFLVSWDKPDDTKNICGYKLYRNGVLIYQNIVQRKYGGNIDETSNKFVDKPYLGTNINKCTYEVRSFDFDGNLSKPSKSITVNITPASEMPNLISKGCKYTISPNPQSTYADNGLKLTDSLYSPNNKVKDNYFIGWYNDPVEITVDLNQICSIRQFSIDYLSNPTSWAELPEKASISVSKDGKNYEPVGMLNFPTVPFSERDGAKYKIFLTLKSPVDARFVKFFSVTKPSNYTFIDEIEVRN